MPPRVDPSVVPPRSGVTANDGSVAAGSVHPKTVEEAQDAYCPQDTGEAAELAKIAGVAPVANRVLCSGLTPVQESMIKVILAAVDLLMPHYDNIPHSGDGSTTTPRRP